VRAIPAQKRTLARQSRTVRFQATTSAAQMQTVRSHIRPHIGSAAQHLRPPKVQIPIDHRLRTAGSGTVDFRAPDGVRNSKRKLPVRFWGEKLMGWTPPDGIDVP